MLCQLSYRGSRWERLATATLALKSGLVQADVGASSRQSLGSQALDLGIVGVDARVVAGDPRQVVAPPGRPPGDHPQAATARDWHVSLEYDAGRDPLPDQLEEPSRLVGLERRR